MELEELKQGLEGIQGEGTQPQGPWLGMDNLMNSYGGWFGNDKGLGELLLGQLRARGVDTQSATEAMLREILSGLVDDLNLLQQRLTGFTQEVAKQVQTVQAVTDSVDTALAQSGGTPESQEVTGAMPPEVEEPSNAEGGEEELPPPAESAPSEEPQAEETPAPEEPSVEEVPPANEEEVPPEETLSDKRMKKVKGCVLSDKGMKKVFGVVSKPKGMTFSPELIAATRRL